MVRRELACSFCGKSETNVAKLVAGPGVYICDQCAAQVVRIMEDSANNGPRQALAREIGRTPSGNKRCRGYSFS